MQMAVHSPQLLLVSNTSGPTAIATTVVNAACGASNGSITLGAVTGGVAPYTYSVDGSAFTPQQAIPAWLQVHIQLR